ncbi:hypothetical protein [Luteimonas sp. gir]
MPTRALLALPLVSAIALPLLAALLLVVLAFDRWVRPRVALLRWLQ